MGYEDYSVQQRLLRSTALGYNDKSKHNNEFFTQNKAKRINKNMDPKDVVRESCFSEGHQDVISVIIALDETGSMGYVPREFLGDGLNTIMGLCLDKGIKDLQICFVGVGDHYRDKAPLQVGQFETGDEKLDKWLTSVWLEGNGGGNNGESYHLTYAFAAFQTKLDSFEKQGRKGYLFTIGDEHCHPNLEASFANQYLGLSWERDYSAKELLALAQEKYNVYHFNIDRGDADATQRSWQKLLGERVILVKDHKVIPDMIADIILETNKINSVPSETQNPVKSEDNKPNVSPNTSLY